LWQFLRRPVITHLPLRDDLSILTTKTREDFSRVAMKHHSFRAQFLLFQVLQASAASWIRHTRIGPVAAAALGRELETDGARGRERIVVPDPYRDLAIKGAEVAGP